jgi:hypothetical protein
MDVYKVTEMRDGCIYKTKKVGSVWVEGIKTHAEQTAIAESLGGDQLVNTMDYHFGREPPE